MMLMIQDGTAVINTQHVVALYTTQDIRKAIAYFEEELKRDCIALSPILEGKKSVRAQFFETAISAMQELQRYREVGPTPDQLREIDKMFSGLCRELGEYQKLEKQGKLLKMPCAVGDTVYDIKFGRVRESEVVRFDSRECGIKNHAEHIHTRHNGFHGVFQTSQFGKTIFPTREEAEAKLAEMEGRNE